MSDQVLAITVMYNGTLMEILCSHNTVVYLYYFYYKSNKRFAKVVIK